MEEVLWREERQREGDVCHDQDCQDTKGDLYVLGNRLDCEFLET